MIPFAYLVLVKANILTIVAWNEIVSIIYSAGWYTVRNSSFLMAVSTITASMTLKVGQKISTSNEIYVVIMPIGIVTIFYTFFNWVSSIMRRFTSIRRLFIF